MPRELNPELFVDPVGSSTQPAPVKPRAPMVPDKIEMDMADLQIISAQIDHLKKRMSAMDQAMAKTQAQIEEIQQSNQLEFDRFKSAINKFEDYVKKGFQDMNYKFVDMKKSLTQRKLGEEKIESLIDRHNQMVQSFEVRMNQLKQVTKEQEIQLMNSRAAINESRLEIERLKRL